MQDTAQVTASYEHCRNIARKAARNFYYGFALLPPQKRDALCALYAFMRHVDDVSDSDGDVAVKKDGLTAWRRVLDRAIAGECDGDRVLPALRHTMTEYRIPAAYFHDLLRGAEMDLKISRYATFDELRQYCYCVAGVVGLCCVHVFGFKDPKALSLAPQLGIAFQLTNILRDVREDFTMGRIYLPQEDLERFGCSESDLGSGRASPAFIDMMKFETARAWKFYEEGSRLLSLVSRDSQPALFTLTRIYSGILRKIESNRFDVLAGPRARLSALEKAWVVVRASARLF